MITHVTGSVLDVDAEALVNTVNVLGYMGKGLALEFKARYPRNFELYKAACEAHQVEIGKMFVTRVVVDQADMFAPTSSVRWIVNFPTKQDFRNSSQMRWIDAGLKDLELLITRHRIRSIAVPALGCGNGGLDWNAVRPRIEAALGPIPDCNVMICKQ